MSLRHYGMVRDKENDDGETKAAKGGGDVSGVGGSTAAGDSLPGMFLFAGKTLRAAWFNKKNAPTGMPMSTILDADGMPLPPTFFANEKGGMTHDMGVRYFENNLRRIFNPPLSVEHPAVIVCDGHGSHLTLELVDWARENNVYIVLRPPHTTHKLQGEDVQNFKAIKASFLKSKQDLLEKLDEEVRKRKRKFLPSSLGPEFFVRAIKSVWEKHFSKDQNTKAWARIGVNPFTRSVYWELKEAEERAQKRCEDVGLNYEEAHRIAFGSSPDEDEDEDANSDDEAVEEEEEIHGRLTSATLWHQGPITADRIRELLAADKKKRTEAEAAKEKARAASEEQRLNKLVAARRDAPDLLARMEDEARKEETIDDYYVQDLKTILIAHRITFKSSMKKAELIQLAKDNGL